MIIGIVTTSRADFGVYLPLLKKIEANKNFEYLLFVSGMHTSEKFGYSHKAIEKEGFKITELLETIEDNDSALAIAKGMSNAIENHTIIWEKYSNKIDLLLVLGDRYEMFAIAASTIPFSIPLAHFHGGETTLGAIDEKFRNALTCFSDYHFTSNESHKENVIRIKGSPNNVFNVGAMGLDNIKNISLMEHDVFLKQFKFNISVPFILMTFHPETVGLKNKLHIQCIIECLKKTTFPVLCTLPNADTEADIIRNDLLEYEAKYPNKIKCIENLGQQGYLTAMSKTKFLLGNSSSGIIEAASFNKPVINLGDRQEGRTSGSNIIHTKLKKLDIFEAIKKAQSMTKKTFENPYGDGNSAEKVIKILEKIIK